MTTTVSTNQNELLGLEESLQPTLVWKSQTFRRRLVRFRRLFVKSSSVVLESVEQFDKCPTSESAAAVVTTELDLTEGSSTTTDYGSISSVSPTTSFHHIASTKLTTRCSGSALGLEPKSSLNPSETPLTANGGAMDNAGNSSHLQHAPAQRSRSQSRSRLHEFIHHPLKSLTHHGHIEQDEVSNISDSDRLEQSVNKLSLNGAHDDTNKRSNSNDTVNSTAISSFNTFNGAAGKVSSGDNAQAKRLNTMDSHNSAQMGLPSSPMEPLPRPHSTARLANMLRSAMTGHSGHETGNIERISPLTANTNVNGLDADGLVFSKQQLGQSLFDKSHGARNIVASAPSSRTVSRHDNIRTAPAMSAAPTINEGKNFLRLRRSLRSGSQVEEGELKDGSLSPAKFLDKSLQKSDWSLSCKYKASHRLLKTNLLGHGATAVVKTVYGLKDREVYACKVYHRKSPTPDQTKFEYFQQLAEEYKIARTLEAHRNVVRTLDLCLNQDDAWCTIMEFCDMGDLFGLLESYKLENKKMSKPERNCLFKQLLMGLSFMHKHDIAHRDIKPENLLINSKGELKISDFGVSTWTRDVNGDLLLSKGLCGSEPYIAPEVFESKKKDNGYDARKVDIWSAAIVYANLAFNGGLFAKADPENAAYVRFAIELKKYWDMEEGLQNYLNGSAQDSQAHSNSMLTPGAMTPAISTTPSVTSPISNRSSRSVSGTVTPDKPAGLSSPTATTQEAPITGERHPEHHHMLSRDAYIFMNAEGSLDQPLFFFNEFGESAKRGIAQMLSPEPHKRPLIQDILSAGWIKKIGMCIGPDPIEEARSGTSTPIDVTNVSSIRKMHSSQVFKNHTHRPPAKAQKQIAMGHLKDPYK